MRTTLRDLLWSPTSSGNLHTTLICGLEELRVNVGPKSGKIILMWLVSVKLYFASHEGIMFKEVELNHTSKAYPLMR